MLISCRKEGESLEIGEAIEVRIISVRKNKVTLGVVAPREVKIETRKLSEMEMANTMAVVQSVHVGQFFGATPNRSESVVFVLEEADLMERSSESTDKKGGRFDE